MKLSQKEKNKCCILMHLKSRKMVLMNLIQGKNGDTDIGDGLVDTAGEGAGGTY